ncbi:phytanoyl-CoA dioxygenase family protein [Streptomyces sp. NPDC051985]|uniref:phytanoyl-CoA dioxygenase family protein n=1 Tax=Streptomyces sp. NPDC051985 TaxID=3155807 RepID=UPI003441A1D5
MRIRDVTDDEVAAFQENGWVKLSGLIDPATASELLRAGHRQIGGPGHVSGRTSAMWDIKAFPAMEGIEPFRSVAFHGTMGRNAQRLMNRGRLTGSPVPVRYLNDSVSCKRAENSRTLPHEDHGGQGLDRIGSVAVWIALDEATPEMGTMRFLTGAFREGPFGHVTLTDILEQYPRLTDLYSWSEPQVYQPGDATVHHCCTIHESLPNTTDRGRWAYILSYASADALRRENPLEYKGFDDARNPIVVSGA